MNEFNSGFILYLLLLTNKYYLALVGKLIRSEISGERVSVGYNWLIIIIVISVREVPAMLDAIMRVSLQEVSSYT